jgi:CO/xanthine dehydrogenase Mo-binding subunit
MNDLSMIGRNIPAVDARMKVDGTARYVGDLDFPGMLHGKILRSPHPHALIRSIDITAAAAMDGVAAVVTGAQLDGLDATYGPFLRDQPVLATSKVRYVGDAVAAVAAIDEETAYRAIATIKVEYQALPSILSPQAALQPGATPLFDARHVVTEALPVVVGNGSFEPIPNVLFEHHLAWGDLQDALSRCDIVLEDRFSLPRLSQFPLEPHIAIANVGDNGIVVWTNNQDAFLVAADLARIFALPPDRVRVLTGFIGGGFGAKSYCKTEPLAVLLSRAARRPVRLALTSDESMATVCEHAAEIVIRTGVDTAGHTLIREADILLDGGAYADASPAVALNINTRIGGPYRWEAVQSRIRVVRTNTVPAGSYRGFGAAHVAWASESQIDMAARRLGQDPFDFRMRNFIPDGEPLAPGELDIDCNFRKGLQAVTDEIGYHRGDHRRGRGFGVAIGLKRAGAAKGTRAQVEIASSGCITVRSALADIGQGGRTAMTQIVAQTLGVNTASIMLADVDTGAVPYDDGTHASSGITVSTLAAARAAALALEQLTRKYREETGQSEATLGNRPPVPILLERLNRDDAWTISATETVDGKPYWLPSWTAAEVEIDDETGLFKVLRLVSAADAGRAIHPEKCRAQIEGGLVQGLGQALFEELQYEGPTLVNGQPLLYRVPRITDVCALDVILLESGQGPGPYGAKGVGEAGNIAVAAAIANALVDAGGTRSKSLPLGPGLFGH